MLTGLLAPLLTFLLAATTVAQTSRFGATLEGTIVDSSVAAIPGAEVSVCNTKTGQVRAVKTDSQGFFRAEELAVGTYDVRVGRPGFAPYLHSGITLSLGQTVQLTIRLVPATVTSQVTVTTQYPKPASPQSWITKELRNCRSELVTPSTSCCSRREWQVPTSG